MEDHASPSLDALAELHLRYDGPIDERLRQAALTGRPPRASDVLASAARELDRLAATTVQSLARLRSLGHHDGEAAARLAAGLASYRRMAMRTSARLAAARAEERRADRAAVPGG